jgi:hypothetical protein
VNKDIDCTSPVAVEVPPPKTVLESSVKVLWLFSALLHVVIPVLNFSLFSYKDVCYVAKQFASSTDTHLFYRQSLCLEWLV